MVMNEVQAPNTTDLCCFVVGHMKVDDELFGTYYFRRLLLDFQALDLAGELGIMSVEHCSDGQTEYLQALG
jgi:hypothetical protein